MRQCCCPCDSSSLQHASMDPPLAHHPWSPMCVFQGRKRIQRVTVTCRNGRRRQPFRPPFRPRGRSWEAIPTAWPVVGGGAGGGWPAGPRWLLQAVRASEEERRRYGMPRAPSDHEGGTVTNPQQTSLQTLHEHGVGLRKYVHDASCRS